MLVTVMRNVFGSVFFLVVLSLASQVLSLSSAEAAQTTKSPSLAGKRVLWLGDSITQAGHYISFVEYYLNKRFPTQNFDFISVGLASETVSGLSEKRHPFPRPCVFERLGRALDAVRPNVVVACYGMNDGIYHPQSTERRKAFEEGIRKLQAAVKARGATLILLTPPPFDPLPVKTLQKVDAPDFAYFAPFEGYDAVLTEYAGWEKTLVSPDVFVVDLHTPLTDFLTARRKIDPSFTFTRDGIHPDEAGHLRMAHIILAALGVPLPAAEGAEGNSELETIHADPQWSLIRKHRETRSEGWLPFIGYTRDKTFKTDSIDATEQAATALQVQIDAHRRAAR